MAPGLLKSGSAKWVLKEEQVQQINIAMDKVAALASGKWLAQKGESPALSFEALFAQITAGQAEQAVAAPARTQPTQAAAGSAKAASTTSTTATVTETPIVRLRQSLEETGQPLERFSVSAGDRDKLEEVLVQSGYSNEQAQEIMKRASEDDGSVNLGAMFALLPDYEPESGPMFLLSEEDKPLFVQVLKDMGCTESEIEQYMDSLKKKDGKLVVTGLPQLLAKAQARDQDKSDTPSVDPAVLSDLLSRLGMDQGEINAMLEKATDGQGRTNAQAVLALLSAAAQRQDAAQTPSVTQLAAKIQVEPSDEAEPSEAAKLKSEVMQILQRGAPRPVAGQQQTAQADQTQTQTQNQQGVPLADAAAQKAATGQAQAAQAAQDNQAAQATQQQTAAGQGQDQTPADLEASARAEANVGANTATDKAGLERVLAEHAATAPQAAAGKDASGQQAAGQDIGQQTARDQTQAHTVETASAAAAEKAGGATVAQGGQSTGTAQAAVEAAGRAVQSSAQTVQSRGSLPAYVVRQVSQQIAQMVKSQQNQLRLELRPPELGELNMKLSVKNGVVRLTMVAESAAAKHALDSGLHDLRAQLVQQGLKPERLEVILSPDAERQMAQQQSGSGRESWGSNSGQGSGGAAALAGEESGSDTAAAALDQNPASGRINLFA